MMKIEIDENLKASMYSEIRAMESLNMRTNKYTDRQMVEKIAKIIMKYTNK